MDGALAVAFWGVSLLFALTPGGDWAYAISAGLRRGGVLPAVAGMLTGHLTATLVVAAGVAAVLAASDTAITLLTFAGAAYLIWLGISALRRPAAPEPHTESHSADTGGSDAGGDIGFGAQVASVPLGQGRLFAKGVGISLLNPKVFLLFLALLPQFTSTTAAWPVGVQMAALGVIHVANCAVVYYAVGYGSAAILTTRPRAARVVGIASGIVMIALGIILAAEKVITHLN